MHSTPVEKTIPNLVILSSDDEQHIDNDKQIVLYDPTSNGSGQIIPVIQPEPNPIQCGPLLTEDPKVLPSVGAFTVQCAKCFKWRFIPSKDKYEEIREHILERPFCCEVAKEWRPEISCDEPGDIEQDGSRLWAIDKPNIAQPPPGWERELRIRAEGSTKFADVYYTSPYGKRLRSMVEIQKYLFEHAEFNEQGVTLSQFSFQIPKPLQENYVRKRTARVTTPGSETNWEPSRPFDPREVNPISWAPPDAPQLVEPGFSGSYILDDSSLDTPPVKKKARPLTEHKYSSGTLHNPHPVKIESPSTPNGVYDL